MEQSMDQVITTAHGSGGSATGELIRDIFAGEFHDEMDDAAVVNGSGRIALTTDSFVVTPQVYKGGDIGRLAVCGTVNDLLMRGSRPSYLTAGFILEEGVPFSLLKKVAHSMAETAAEAGVRIVAGDTKVVEGRPSGGTGGTSGSANGGSQTANIYINTAGCGLMGAWDGPGSGAESGSDDPRDISAESSVPGDAIIVSGTMGDHHATILGARMGIDVSTESDNAPLTDMVGNLMTSGIRVHTMRDITRGGLGTVLKELAEASGHVFMIREESIPVAPAVRDFCRMMGLDPLYMGNEGKMVCIVDNRDADRALQIIRQSRYGENASVIGKVCNPATAGFSKGEVIMKTLIGGERSIGVLQGEGLPRIC